MISIFDPIKETWEHKTPTGELPHSYDRDIVWDELQKVFVCFPRKGGVHYYSPAENKWYRPKVTGEVDELLRRVWHHHIYDPVNNVHIGIGYRWRTFAFKFSDKAGKFPGTGMELK